MSKKDWQAFITVADTGNISKAAECLFLSQPALSYRIRQIEEQTGASLLLRNAHGITLTPAGEVFYDYCRRMLKEEEAMQQHIVSVVGDIQGTLRIASSINFADYELPLLLRRFMLQYPRVHIEVKMGYSHQVASMFNNRECTVAFKRGEHKCTGNTVTLMQEPYCLVCYKPVCYADLKHIPMIRYRSDHSVMLIFDNWCAENLPALPEYTMELDSMLTCRHFIHQGLGWSILPYLGLGHHAAERLYVEPLRDKQGHDLVRNTDMVYETESLKLSTVRAFVEFTRQYYAEQPPLFTGAGET